MHNYGSPLLHYMVGKNCGRKGALNGGKTEIRGHGKEEKALKKALHCDNSPGGW